MSQSFVEFISEQKPDSGTLQQSLRYYLGERTDDLPPEDMREALIEATGQAQEVDETLRRLERDTELLDRAALEFLATAWNEPGEEARIRQAFLSANQKLPVIELGILAIVAMYGMYLLTTGGVKVRARSIKREADGSVHEEDSTTYAEVGGALSAITRLFHRGRKQDETAPLPA